MISLTLTTNDMRRMEHYIKSYKQRPPELHKYMPRYEKGKLYFIRTNLNKCLTVNYDLERGYCKFQRIVSIAQRVPKGFKCILGNT